MKRLNKSLLTALGALVAAGGLAATSSSSAAIVCNSYHECWHVKSHYDYPVNVGIALYDDAWAFPDATYHWLTDRDDRGYWVHHHWHRF
jgi:hypothetical protein